MGSSGTWSFHHQVCFHQVCLEEKPHTSLAVSRRGFLRLDQADSTGDGSTLNTESTTLDLKTPLNRLETAGSRSFQVRRRGTNFRFLGEGTLTLRLLASAACCWTTSSPGMTLTSVTSLRKLFRYS